MKVSCLVLLTWPSLAAGHGIALPITDRREDVLLAGSHSIEFVRQVVEGCGEEISQCAAVAADRWEEGARCLIENIELLASEGCRAKVANVARHLPFATLASRPESLTELLSSRTELPERSSSIGSSNLGCNASGDVLPYIWSYHIHIQWDFGHHEARETADNFTKKFLKEFQPNAKICARLAFLEDLWNKESIPANQSENHPFADICEMSVYPPGGPFLHAERGFIISPLTFHAVVPWIMANRPVNNKLYILIHPNSGCQYNDLYHWSMWAGPSVSMFYDILRGCVWASCEDKTLGCIAFNHFGESKGYGPCYTPPTAMNLDCKMTLEETSNTSTLSCPQPPASVAAKDSPTTRHIGASEGSTSDVPSALAPATMMAGALTKRNLKLKTLPYDDIKFVSMKVPSVEKDQVLLKVEAASINPCEWKFPMGMESPLDWIPSYPLVLARDCLGTIVAVGSGVDDRLKVGDVVWANQAPFKQGCASEYAALDGKLVTQAPSKLPAAESAVMPLVSLTALDALRFTGAPWNTTNKTILILGGSGGVGHIAIQMAKAWGATQVITTCGTDHIAFCTSVGADWVIDYHKHDFHAVVKNKSVDAVADLVGLQGTGDKAYDLIRDHGFFVTLLPYAMPSMSAKLKRPDIKHLFSNTVYWHHEDLDIVRELVDAGKLRPYIDKAYSSAELVPAFKYLIEGHTTGKIAISIAHSNNTFVV